MEATRHRTRAGSATLIAAAAVAACLWGAVPAGATNLDGGGMWIWYVSRSSGGNPDRMAAKAQRNGVRTVIIKAADAGARWRQFSPALVSALKARGIRVCAYQFVYGKRPRTEARRGAVAARLGADCLLIDAEGHYEGRYGSARTYMRSLRRRVGRRYPVGLTGFPYVHYHPSFPYSVFLGPGGAQFNVPQMYWKAIGTSVDQVFSTTYRYNRPYKRPIYPLGQVYGNPRSGDVSRFRRDAIAYGARGVSWWVWQFAGNRQWTALGSPFAPVAGPYVDRSWPVIRRGNRSDLVVWAQQHLRAQGIAVRVDGVFGGRMQNDVRLFQSSRGLPVSGQLDNYTWPSLLAAKPKAVSWSSRRRPARAASAPSTPYAPDSARRHARRNELRGSPRG